ncbi:efflux RND transporter permease subunit [Methylocella sp. CPCC 101449]|jgi:hydrophobe/amphiphile efflux-1 (HAE1) family protein|uniref:efflux RND transporter permease subunit n=1 Tax=Methylocella sp. CPCC 101449 TaxID=2987531 RepID=UPI0028911A0F|nr:efflux RND transporter permease subunit [Methylocella sp. CPCC 101449]MDT2019859.1 efflux RND transporter permease subunit [Methylocella sp. CPCC 101449]HEV2575235.1 efflux RND transporter permease subunit [Beijerinckiaceae bacterium]
MSISSPFISRPIATSLLMAGLLLAGLAAYPFLPVAPLPQIDYPTLLVSASLPGASPETMASSVAAPLERQFAQIAGVTQMTSTSALGTAQVAIQFDLNRNIDGAALDVQTAISAAGAQLPKNLPSNPTVRKFNPADAPVLVLAAHSDTMPLTQVDDYVENVLAQRISQISGVGYVTLGGQRKPSVRVQVDPAKLAALGIGLEDVANTISSATVNAPKGSLNGITRNFTIYDNDQLFVAKPWNDVIIAYRNGSPVRVKDIGVAIDGPEDVTLSAWQNGKPGIQLQIYKQPGANVVDTVQRVQATMPQIKAAMPAALQVDTVVDLTRTIQASVKDVQFTLLLTTILVVMVIFVFLRTLWATIIPAVTVPLALLGTTGLMYLLGYSLDNLSLMGLSIAVGFVVDDAIVMLENIHRHIEDGLSPMQAAYKGSAEIGFTILSISISLVAVFIPLLLMGGIVGRLFREFAIVVTMTILVSGIVALTLTPMMCSRFLRSHADEEAHHGRFYKMTERGFDWVLGRYAAGLDLVLRHQRLTLAVFVATVVATVGLYVVIPKGFFPQQDTGVIVGLPEGGQDVSATEMSRLAHALTDVIAKDPDVESWSASTGGSRGTNAGFVFISLKPRDERTATADQVIARLRPQLAKVQGAALFLQARQDLNVGGRLARTQFQYTLSDVSLDELNQWAPRLLAKLKTLPELRDVASDQQTNATMVSVKIDRDQAARFGIQPSLIDQTLYDAFGQRQVTQYFTQLNAYHVVLEVDPKLQSDPNALDKIYVKSPTTGQQVPLSAMAKFDTSGVNYVVVNHQGQFPAVTLSFNLAPGVALGDATVAVEKAAADIGMPASITGGFQGTAQAFQASLASQPYLVLAALITVYIILGVLYESYIHPLTILSTLPSAGVGALLMLMAFHFDLSVIAMIGIILLIGIVKKNGIMMVDFAIQAERKQGLTPVESIRQACLLRFRPIMMTTMAAMLGAVPLMLGNGTGSELRQPLGYTMVGGLILSQMLTLFTTPIVYLYLDRLGGNFGWTRRHRKQTTSTPAMRELPEPAE